MNKGLSKRSNSDTIGCPETKRLKRTPRSAPTDPIVDECAGLEIGYSFKECHNEYDSKCGRLPEKIGIDIFQEKNIESCLDDTLNIDHDILSLAVRAIYHFNCKKEDKLLIHPIFLGVNSELIQCINSLEKNDDGIKQKIIVPKKLQIEFDHPIGIFLPDKSLNHIVCVKVVFNKKENKKGDSIETKVFDSAYCSDNKKIGSPKSTEKSIEGQVEDKDVEYNESNSLIFYQSLVEKYIIPSLVTCLNGTQNSNSINTTTELKKSVRNQLSPDDNTCGINSSICMMLMMIGKDPSEGVGGLNEHFEDHTQYHKGLMLLFLLSIHKYLMVMDVKYFKIGSNRIMGKLSEHARFNSRYYDLWYHLKDMKIDFQTALGAELYGMFDFLDLENLDLSMDSTMSSDDEHHTN